MTKEKLKKAIKKKFKSLSNFARCAGIDRMKLQIFFAKDTRPSDEEFTQMVELYKVTPYKETGNVIDFEKVERLRASMEAAGGVYRYCKENNLPMEQVYNLLNGKRKRHTKFIQLLFDKFQIA